MFWRLWGVVTTYLHDRAPENFLAWTRIKKFSGNFSPTHTRSGRFNGRRYQRTQSVSESGLFLLEWLPVVCLKLSNVLFWFRSFAGVCAMASKFFVGLLECFFAEVCDVAFFVQVVFARYFVLGGGTGVRMSGGVGQIYCTRKLRELCIF